MGYISTCTLKEGEKALNLLLSDLEIKSLDWNEAETRFQIIDRILINCLGWPKELIRLEQPQGRKYTDYEPRNKNRNTRHEQQSS